MAVFKAMIHNGYHGNTADVIATVQTMPDPGLTKTVSFASGKHVHKEYTPFNPTFI